MAAGFAVAAVGIWIIVQVVSGHALQRLGIV